MDLTVEQVAQKATGTYQQAGQVLSKAEEYINAALQGATSWWGSATLGIGTLPGDGTRRAALQEIQALEQRLGANSYPEQLCPDWEQARNLLWQAHAEYEAVGEGNAKSVENLVHLGDDLVTGTGEVIGSVVSGAANAAGSVTGDLLGGLFKGLGLAGVIILGAVGVGAYFYIKKGATV